MRDVRQYAAVATGFIDIPENGVYFFSSDLEEVWVGGKLLVNNGGEVKRHSRNDRSIALEKGMHELKLVFLGTSSEDGLRTGITELSCCESLMRKNSEK